MIELSQAAAQEVKRLQTTRAKTNSHLRIGLESGGCAELCYTLKLDETINPEDRIWESQGLSIVVESRSQDYLKNLT